MDGFEHSGDFFYLAGGYRRPHVAIKMHYAALPLRLRIKLGKVLHQTQALVGYEQLHPFKPRCFNSRRKFVQLALSSLAPSLTPKESPVPCPSSLMQISPICLHFSGASVRTSNGCHSTWSKRSFQWAQRPLCEVREPP